MRKPWIKRTFKWLGWTSAILIWLGLLIVFLVSLSPVQNWLVQQTRGRLEKMLGVPVEIAEVDVALPARVVLGGVAICDQKGGTMVGTQEVRVNLLSFSLWRYILEPNTLQTLSVSGVSVIQPEANIYRSPDGKLNLQFLLDAFAGEEKEEKKSGGSLPFNISLEDLRIANGSFFYCDSTRLDSSRLVKYEGKLNPNRMQVRDLNLNLSANLDTSLRAKVHLEYLSLTEQFTNWTLDHLSFHLTADSLQRNGLRTTYVRDLELDADDTHILAWVHLPDQGIEEWTRFDESVRYEVVLKPGNQVDFHTVNILAAQNLPLYGTAKVDGEFSGSLKSVIGQSINLGIGDSTRFVANLAMTEILESARTRMDVSLVEGKVLPLDLERMLTGIDFPQQVDNLRTLGMTGRFIGGYYDFDARFNSQTQFGQLAGDVHMTMPPLVPRSQYKGRLIAKGFNVDALGVTADPVSTSLNLNTLIEGAGFSLEQGKLKLDGLVYQSDVMGYAVDTIQANVRLASQQLEGHIYAFDGTGRVDLETDLDLSKSPNVFIAKGSATEIDLNRYEVIADTQFLNTSFDINLEGDSIEGLVGTAKLLDTRFRKYNGGAELVIPQFELQSDYQFGRVSRDSIKHLGLASSLLNADITGNFTFDRAGRFLRELQTEADLFLANDDSLITAYYDNKIVDSTDFDIEIFLQPQDSINRFFSFFEIPAYLEIQENRPAVTASMNYIYSGPGIALEEAYLQVDNLDTLYVEGIATRVPTCDINLVKDPLENVLLLSGGMYCNELYPDPRVHLSQISLIVQGDSRDFTSDLSFVEADSQLQVGVNMQTFFRSDGSIINQLKPEVSYLIIQQDSILFTQADTIGIKGDSIWIEGIRMVNSNRTRSFETYGVVSPREEDILHVGLENLELSTLNELVDIGYDVDGTVDVNADIRGVLGETKVNLRSDLADFSLDGYHYGNFDISSVYIPGNEALDIEAKLFDVNDTTLLIKGQYLLDNETSPLAFSLSTQKGFPLGYITPFVDGELYGIEGRVGLQEFTIRGTPSNPVVNGVGFFEEAGFGVSYFKTQYSLRGRILFDNDRITLEDLRLLDRFNSLARRAYLHGDILHNNLREFRFDLQVDSVQNFLFMDTKKADNDLFYGTLYLKNALADITGDLKNLSMNAIASFGRGSVLRLPLTNNSTYGRPDYIIFQSDRDTTADRINTGLLGYEISLTALLTENLEVELIFDERVGDIIRGRGEGNLNMLVDESGSFSMFGRFEVTQGDYLFTSQNVINKKFEVVPGGSIIWTGDPYDAQIDIEARYPVMADIRDIIGSDQAVRVPTNVLMHMEGSLEQPEISLSIEINNLSESSASDVISYIRAIQNDEQELNKQVFSLMAFNRFAPAGLTSQLAGTGVTSSISELLSNQFNYWFSQVTNDKVNVNVNASNFQDINLLISAKLFNDRVTIERDGGIPGTSSTNNQDQLSSLIGDISILIRLLPNEESSNNQTRPSELVLEVFNRNSLTESTFGGNNTSVQTGLGIFFKKDFDRLQELLRRQKKDKESRRESEE